MKGVDSAPCLRLSALVCAYLILRFDSVVLLEMEMLSFWTSDWGEMMMRGVGCVYCVYIGRKGELGYIRQCAVLVADPLPIVSYRIVSCFGLVWFGLEYM